MGRCSCMGGVMEGGGGVWRGDRGWEGDVEGG